MNLRERRLESGLTQAQLAARAGVSRQLVAAVEAGRHHPSVDAALRLARALGTSVEVLFGDAPDCESVLPVVDSLPPDGVPIRLGRVGDQLVAAAVPDHGVAGAGWARADAVFDHGRVQQFQGASAEGAVVAGCDPALGLAEAMLDGFGPRSVMAVSAPTGAALRSLRDGRLHAALVHGIADQLPDQPVTVSRWHFARWQVGVGVAPAQRARSLGTLIGAGVRIVQRDAAAASQQAFDRARAALGLPAAPTPAGTVAAGHLEGARAAAMLGIAAVTTESAARAFELRFIPLEEHTVELWVDDRWLGHPGIEALQELFASTAFTQRVAGFGGYDLTGSGNNAAINTTKEKR